MPHACALAAEAAGKKSFKLLHNVEKSPKKGKISEWSKRILKCPLYLLRQLFGIRFNVFTAPNQCCLTFFLFPD